MDLDKIRAFTSHLLVGLSLFVNFLLRPEFLTNVIKVASLLAAMAAAADRGLSAYYKYIDRKKMREKELEDLKKLLSDSQKENTEKEEAQSN